MEEDNGNIRFKLKSLYAILSIGFVSWNSNSRQNPVVVIIRYHLVDNACNVLKKKHLD